MDDKVHLGATKEAVACGEPRVRGTLVSGDLQHVTCENCQAAAGNVQASEVIEEEEQNG